jgi:hypothetical protein
MNCSTWSEAMNVNVKTKIRYKEQEYSDPNQLPPEVRAAYEKAMADGSATKKIVINGQEFANENDMPRDVRRLCDDVISVIENNGEVTLPVAPRSDPLITKRQLQVVVLLVAVVIFGAWLVIAK